MPTAKEQQRAADAKYRANLNSLGISVPRGPQAAMRSPTGGGFADWMDFPSVVQVYAESFPHNGPMDRRTQDWEAQVEPSSKPQHKRPRGPGESVIMS